MSIYRVQIDGKLLTFPVSYLIVSTVQAPAPWANVHLRLTFPYE